MTIDPKDVILAGLLLLGLIVVVNVGLWVHYRRSNPTQQANAMKNTARRAQDPWGEENENLKKLNDLANDLRKSNQEQPPQDQK